MGTTASKESALLTTKQVAERFSIPLQTLYNWAYLGFGPPRIRYRGMVRYRRSDVEQWLDEHTERPDVAPA